MDKQKTPLRIRIMLTVATIIIVLILGALFLKFPDNTYEKFTYKTNENGDAVILGYTGDAKTLTLPSEIDGHKVVAIGERAFGGLKSPLEKITIPEGVTVIEKDAFFDCKELTRVNLPSSLRFIGEGAFSGCEYLVSISLPNGLETIDVRAFYSCIRLGSLKIPASVKEIGTDAFLTCESLVLDVSESPLAAEVAKNYGIPTSFKDSDSFYMGLAVTLTVISIALFITVVTVGGKLAARKREKRLLSEKEKENNS